MQEIIDAHGHEHVQLEISLRRGHAHGHVVGHHLHGDHPEELEEIRKREERKDRLHQNYLKRKASGAQKRYEDKIKKRKKAEIEAKKAAIRAEDIAKGVFVPVSSLPQREPQKGTQIA